MGGFHKNVMIKENQTKEYMLYMGDCPSLVATWVFVGWVEFPDLCWAWFLPEADGLLP